MRNSQQEIANPKTRNTISKESNPVTTDKKKQAFFTTKKITLTATLTAMTLLFKIMGQALTIGGTVKISFTYIGWILSGIILGPIGGAIVGIVTDILAPFILYNGFAFNPVITLGAALYPMIVGFCYKYLPFKIKNISLVIGTVLATIIATLGVTTLGIYYISLANPSYSFWTYLLTMRTPQLLVIGVNLTLVLILVPIMKRIKLID